MQNTAEALTKEAVKTIALWNKQIITETDAVGRLLYDFVEAFKGNRVETIAVSRIVAEIPKDLRQRMIERLEERDQNGQRMWWLGCDTLLNPPGKVKRDLGPVEETAIRQMIDLLSSSLANDPKSPSTATQC